MSRTFLRSIFPVFAFMCASLVHSQQDTLRKVHLKEVQISGHRPHNVVERMKPVEGEVIAAGKKNEVVKVADLDADLSTNNARQVFAKVPGISIWENDGSGIQMSVAARGLSPNRSWEFNVRQNGYDIAAEPFGYPEAYYSPPMEAVERIEIIRGSASLQFGPQFGGLLNYRLKRGVAGRKLAFETRQTVGSYGLFNAYNALGGTVGRTSYYAFWHHRSADGWRTNGRYVTNTGHVSVTHAFSSRFSVGLEYTRMDYSCQQPGGLTDAQFQLDPQASVRARNWFSAPWNVAAITADMVFTERTRLNLKCFGTFAERNSVGFVRPITEPDTISSVTRAYAPRQVDRDEYANAGAELRLLHTYTLLGKPGSLATGVRVFRGTTQRYQQGKGTTGSDLDLSLTDPVYGRELGFGTNNFAVFAENVFNVGKNVSIVPGVRYEQIVSTVDGYLNTSSTGNLAPDRSERQVLLFGTGLEYRTTTSTNAYANFSTAYRPVLYSELTPSATTDIIDPDLKDANGYNLEAGYRGSLARYVTFDVGVFQLLYRDRIGTVQRDGAAYRTNIGTSLSQGVEAYVEVDVLRLVAGERPASLRVHASVTWMDARYTSWNNPALVNDPVRGIEGKRVEYAPSNIERYGVNYQRKGFSATVQLSRTGPVYTDAANTEEPNAAATVGRLAGYQVLDIHGGHTFRNGLELRLGVNNLMDEVYATRRAGGYPGPGVLPGNGRTFLVTLGARL